MSVVRWIVFSLIGLAAMVALDVYGLLPNFWGM